MISFNENTRQLLELIEQTPDREWNLTWNVLKNESAIDGKTFEEVVSELLQELDRIQKRRFENQF
jgi:hypothetical protein